MKLRLILIALMALLAFNASETSLADNNTRTSGNTTTGTGYFQNGRPFVVISKEEMKMRVYDATGRELRCYPIACGRNVGNKKRQGDMRTPVGLFKVQEILDAHTWTHDFKDGKGVIRGAYGPYFVRLLTGHKGIGIHGTRRVVDRHSRHRRMHTPSQCQHPGVCNKICLPRNDSNRASIEERP